MDEKFNFETAIVSFNHMYGLPVSPVPLLVNAKRIRDFLDIIRKEVTEGEDILKKMELLEAAYKLQGMHAEDGETVAWPGQAEQELEVLTDMADWLGDIQVYCASEMAKWGLPLDPVLQIIMESNMSKLGADGMPIVDESGKVQKGPNYWKPEPKIKEMLAGKIIKWRTAMHKKMMADRLAAIAAAAEKQG